MSAALERSLFATKGRAAPAGTKAAALADAETQAAADPKPTLAVPPSPTDAEQERVAADEATIHGHATPVGSLLTFRLRSVAGKSPLTDEIKMALRQPAAGADEATSTAMAPATAAAPPAAQVTAAAPEVRLDMPAGEPAPAIIVAEADRSGESGSRRIDRPLFPRAPAAHPPVATADAASGTAVVPPGSSAYWAPRPSAARTVLPVAAAVLAIAVVGWLIADSESPADTHGATPEPAVSAAPDSGSATPLVATTAGPAAIIESPATAADQRALTPLPTAPLPADPTASSLADPPTLDVVRVEPGAPPVLAGRAAPGSELIVLDNGTPIGTVIADGNGEWALVGDAPLPAGRHELSLALKTPEGAVVGEQADTQATPGGAADGPAADLPTPQQKPMSGAAPETVYVIQLASVPAVADAEREWIRLQADYPALLGKRSVEINAAEVGDRGTFYRVRTGPFADRDAARGLCRELNAAGQECLVVRAAAD